MKLYRVKVEHGVITENLAIRARSADEAFEQAILMLERCEKPVPYAKIEKMRAKVIGEN